MVAKEGQHPRALHCDSGECSGAYGGCDETRKGDERLHAHATQCNNEDAVDGAQDLKG